MNLWVDERAPAVALRAARLELGQDLRGSHRHTCHRPNHNGLDHDLEPDHYQVPEGGGSRIANDERTGYHIVMWMIETGVWPERIILHSMNPVGRERMAAAIHSAGRECEILVACVQGGAR